MVIIKADQTPLILEMDWSKELWQPPVDFDCLCVNRMSKITTTVLSTLYTGEVNLQNFVMI